jgi:hypothetical protein
MLADFNSILNQSNLFDLSTRRLASGVCQSIFAAKGAKFIQFQNNLFSIRFIL